MKGKCKCHNEFNYKGKINIIYGSDALASIDMDVKLNINKLISEIKTILNYIALETGGENWAKKFDYLWWKTSLSEKNSPSEPYWFELFKIVSISNQIKSNNYTNYIVVCDDNLKELINQIKTSSKIQFIDSLNNKKLFRFHRFILARFLGLICLYNSYTFSIPGFTFPPMNFGILNSVNVVIKSEIEYLVTTSSCLSFNTKP